MAGPAQSVLSLAFRRSYSAASIFRASTLTRSHDYPISLSSVASLGTFSLSYPSLVRLYRFLFRRFSGFTLLFFLLFCAFYAWQIALFVLSVMRLVDMYRFYTYLLQIPDVRIPSMYLRSSPNISVGRYPDYLVA